MVTKQPEGSRPGEADTAHKHETPILGRAVIKVLGLGGGGSNAVSRMYKDRLAGIEYYCLNTDLQHLEQRCTVPNKLPLGMKTTRGLGAGGNPEIGRQAAEENREEIAKLVKGSDLVFITAGMGGGTGTGAAPVLAAIAKEAGALVVGVVTKPFSFEAGVRKRNAEEGIKRLRESADTLIVIPNDKLLEIGKQKEQHYSWDDALKMADSVLDQGVQTIAEVISSPGEINVDFANVKAVLTQAGPAWLAIGKAKGENRAIDAAKMATRSPLLDIAIEGAKRILFMIAGGNSLTLKEVQLCAEAIQQIADPEAAIFFGTIKDPKMEDEIRVTLVASAFPAGQDTLLQSEQELKKLLRDALPQEEEELELPAFMRRNHRRLFH